MFGFGFGGTFIITQMHGLGLSLFWKITFITIYVLLAIWAFWDHQEVNRTDGSIMVFPENLTEIGRMGPSMAMSGMFFWACWYILANLVALP